MAKHNISISDPEYKPLREIIPKLSATELKSLEECFGCARLAICDLDDSQCNDGTGHCNHHVPLIAILTKR